MATIGSLVIGLSLGTTGMAMGLNNVEAQLKAFQNRVNGQGAMTAQAAAYEQVRVAQLSVVMAQQELNVSTLRLTELQAIATTRASTLAGAQLTVTRSTMALAAANADLVAAQNLAAAPVVASQMGGHFPFITAAATIAGYALVMFSVNAARAAAAFEYEMRLIQTQAAATREEVVQLSDSILQMAPGLQTGPMELSKSMFRFKSVGLDNANALEAMKYAAMGARVGNASLDSVTTALIATMISGIDGIDNWAQAMGMLNAVVGVSNLRMEDLTSSLSSGILSTARQFGLDFLDVGAALGVMSNQAVPAEEGATRLRISIALLAAPTAIATRELAKIGLTQRAIADQMRGEGGLLGALTLLKTRMDAAGLDAVEQSMLLKTAFGGSRSSAGILLLMNSLDELGAMYVAVQNKAGSFAEDWAAESETAAANFATFGATVNVLSIRIGAGLLPVLTHLALILGFVADKTMIVVPLFYLIITALGVALVRAIWSAVAGFISLTLNMAANAAAAVLLRTSFMSMGPIIAGNMAVGGAGLAGFTAAATAAAAAAAGLVPVVGSAAAAMAGTAASTGPVIAGMAGVSGAMAVTTASTGPVIAGFAGASGAMAATSIATGPLVAGMAGASGAMVAGAASTGPLVAGLAGVDGAILATTASTGPLVAGLVGADGAILATTASTGALILPMAAAGPAGMAGAAGVGALGTASAAATPAVWSLSTAIAVLTAPITIVILAIVAVIAAIVLLVLNFDKVVQGLRALTFMFQTAKVAILDFMASVPVIGEAFKGAAATAHAELESIRADIAKAQADIDAKGGGGFDPFGDMSKLVQLQIDAAKAEANKAFADLNDTLIMLYGTSMAGVEQAANAAGAKDMAEYAKGVQEAQDLPRNAFADLVKSFDTEMTPQAEAARLVGILQSEEYARGLSSGSPAVRAYYETLKKTVEDRLNEISDGGYRAAGQTWDQFYDGWYAAQLSSGKLMTDVEIELRGGKMADLKAEFAYLKKMWEGSLAPSPEEARAAMQALRDEIATGAANVNDAAKVFVDQFGYNLSALQTIGATAGADMMTAIADAIESKQDAVMTAISKLHDVIINGLSTAAQEAFLMAALAGEDIANGLASAESDVYARAVVARDLIIAQLDFLSNGSYSKGQEAFVQWSQGYVSAAGAWVPPQTGPAPSNSLGLTADQLAAGKSSYEKYLASLSSSTSSFTSQYKSDMTAAFNEIKAKALEYFDAVHDKNLRAIKDAHDHKEALLDAKEALNQAPVTAAQKALDAQRKEIQEWRLRQAVASAGSPEEYRDAVLALQDFLAQKKIDEMQAQVDGANDILDKKKKANDDQETARIEAENERYQKQKKDFQRNLTALEAYLKNHPEAWRKTQNEILALLNEYGISYKIVGNVLGADFATGLREQVAAAKAAGDALAAAAGQGISETATAIAAAAAAAAAVAGTTTAYEWYGTGDHGRASGGPVYKGQPTWVGELGKEMFVPQTSGYVVNHTDSMRALSDLQPAASPVSLDTIRRATERTEVSSGNARVDVAASRASEGVSGGKTTVVFQVGDRTFGEIADITLYQQKAMRERNSVTKVGASRR